MARTAKPKTETKKETIKERVIIDQDGMLVTLKGDTFSIKSPAFKELDLDKAEKQMLEQVKSLGMDDKHIKNFTKFLNEQSGFIISIKPGFMQSPILLIGGHEDTIKGSILHLLDKLEENKVTTAEEIATLKKQGDAKIKKIYKEFKKSKETDVNDFMTKRALATKAELIDKIKNLK